MPIVTSARARRAALSLLAGLLAAVVVWLVTADGPVLTPDGFSYLGAARSLVARGALRVPAAEWRDADSTAVLRQFPPAYPIALAAAMYVAPPLLAARLVGAGAALVTVAGLTDLVAGVAGLAAGAMVLPLLLALRGVALAHVAALSEPPFLAALVATLACMVRMPRRAWTYGVAAAVADLVRYAGVSLVGAAAVWGAWHGWHAGDDRRGRLRRAVGGALAGGAPGVVGHLLWIGRVQRAGLQPVGAAPRWTGHAAATFAEGARTIGAHVAPVAVAEPWRAVLACLVAAGVVAVVVRGWRATRDVASPAPRTMAACAVIAASYAAVIVYARLFVGDAIPFDDRIVAPLLVCGAVVALVAAGAAWPAMRRHVLAGVLAVLWLAAGIGQTVGEARDVLTDRDDYASPVWGATPVAAWLRGEGRRFALFTNDPVAIYFTVDRPSRTLPETLAPDSVAAFAAAFRARGGALVAYPRDVGFGQSADPARLASALGLCAVLRDSSGTVWVAGPGCVPAAVR
ncbi:MAG: hypothetical protein JO180_01640 [Gemmatirosa sp.]|nr:hypothetical protein [Gemmatirosa sp.]